MTGGPDGDRAGTGPSGAPVSLPDGEEDGRAAPTPSDRRTRVSLRPARADDVAAVALLERELFGADAWSAAQVREELLGERRRAWVAELETSGDGGRGEATVVGYAVTLLAGDVADLQRIGVHPAHRRRGLARLLLAGAVDAARADGAVRLLLEVSETNAAATGFYAAEGFAEIDRRRRYYRDGSAALVLERSLQG